LPNSHKSSERDTVDVSDWQVENLPPQGIIFRGWNEAGKSPEWLYSSSSAKSRDDDNE
jgi:hypothetical protein